MHIYCCYTLSTSPVICIPCVARCTKSLSYLPTACCTSYMPRAATPYSVMPILLLHHTIMLCLLLLHDIHWVMPILLLHHIHWVMPTAAAPYPLGYANCCCMHHIIYYTAAAPYPWLCLLLLLHHTVIGYTAAAPYPWLYAYYCCCTISY